MKDKELNLDEIMQEFGGEEEPLNPEEAAVSHSMTDTQDLLDSIAQINGRTQQAEEIAEETHIRQKANVGKYPLDIAKSKVAKATKMARAEGFPLKFDIQPE